MADSANFGKLVPGFDFLEGLVKSAGAAMPGVGQWIAPTINPEELDKRIEELRTVQYWLEQNARMLGATIQALEVQRMTLSTLKTMNVQMDALRDSMLLKMPTDAPPAAASEPAESTPTIASEAAPEAAPKAASQATSKKTSAPGAVDPMQWWGALTKQFTQLASAALKDGAAASTDGAAAMKEANDIGDKPAAGPAKRTAASRTAASRTAASRKAASRKAASRKAAARKTG